MYLPTDEQQFVTSLAQVDRCLMHSLAVSHGLEFAAVFRIEFADEVARAMWESAKLHVNHAPNHTIT